MNVQVEITLPDDLGDLDNEKVSREVFEQVVAESYRSGQLGPAQVRKLMGFKSRSETEDFLHRYQAMEYTVEDLKSDLETLEKLGL